MSTKLLESAQNVVQLLRRHDTRLVLAESCTCGRVACTLGLVPGVSAYFCGSWVTYRLAAKQHWLGVEPEFLQRYTAESPEAAAAIASGALQGTPEADWSLGIVGHLGPGVEPTLDGVIYMTVCFRTSEGFERHPHQVRLQAPDRETRQTEAAELALRFLASVMVRSA